jgi:hypothetical protein
MANKHNAWPVVLSKTRQAVPRVAAIVSVVETCRRLNDGLVPDGLFNFQSSSLSICSFTMRP